MCRSEGKGLDSSRKVLVVGTDSALCLARCWSCQAYPSMRRTTGFDWRLSGFDWRAHWARPADSRSFELEHVDNDLGDRVVGVMRWFGLTVRVDSEGSCVWLCAVLG